MKISNKSKTLVIGSNSFSGSHFVNYLLKKNFSVIGVSRSREKNKEFIPYKWLNKNLIRNFKFYKIDINKKLDQIKLMSLIKKFKPKYIVNFSAQGMVEQSWLEPLDWYNTNFISMVKFVNQLKDLKFIEKFIQFSTPEVYGNIEKKTIETAKFNPSTPYAVSRAAFDMHLKILFDNYKFPVVITRAANVYGPFQPLYRIIPKTIYCSFNNIKINLDGGGQSIRSFIYIEDVCEMLLKIMIKGKKGETYHMTNEKLISIDNLVKLIITKIAKNFKIISFSKEREGKDFSYNLSSKKITRQLKQFHITSLDEGIKKTIQWYVKNKKKFNIHNLKYIHKK